MTYRIPTRFVQTNVTLKGVSSIALMLYHDEPQKQTDQTPNRHIEQPNYKANMISQADI